MTGIIGFIGSGNMASAMIGGIIKAGLTKPSDIITSDISRPALEKLEQQFSIRTTTDNKQAAKEADYLVLAVKPIFYADVIDEIKEIVKPDVKIIVIAAGQSLENVEKSFGRPMKIIRTMPNTPALVGEGMTAICPNALITDEELEQVQTILSSFGKAEVVPERLMDAVIAASGSSPAYVYMFIEAMADAAVAQGMPRPQAYKFAAQAVKGAAEMVLQTGEHPGALKDMVCSPGGTTIAAVCELEKTGMRASVMSAMKVCADKSREMTKSQPK